MRRRWRVAVAAAVAGLLLAGCDTQSGKLDHGRVFGFDTPQLKVAVGQTFSLYRKLAVVPGQRDWTVVDPQPDPGVLKVVGPDYLKGGGGMGDGGSVYLVFKAVGKGGTDFTVQNCGSCDAMLRPTYQVRETYHLVVG
ncbi:hypothetical protein [Kitasatospora viridis]|uniref:Chagasin family peptidase inhibitor I42 n=1 Tax=Kitasatospora viridis TaxID=281105 RepID=A0A561ULB5_9ACTN|nr:hypothetical protein [Kitasatospora viridis]TWG00137.1 hypothetical protein FHX73_114006 [Kitasatospora viridis]